MHLESELAGAAGAIEGAEWIIQRDAPNLKSRLRIAEVGAREGPPARTKGLVIPELEVWRVTLNSMEEDARRIYLWVDGSGTIPIGCAPTSQALKLGPGG